MDTLPPDPSPTPAPPAPEPASGTPTADERQWAMFAHLAGLVGLVIPPVGQILGPLIVWLIKKDTMPFVNQEGKEAVNFQISATIYGIVSALAIFVCVGWIMLAAVIIFDIVVVIMASVEASNGKPYRYPLCIRFIK